MTIIDWDFLKTFRETADWILAFPKSLVAAAVSVPDFLTERKVRIGKLKEIIEIRELCKLIQNFALFKSSLVGFIQSIQRSEDVSDVKHLRELLDETRDGLKNLREYLLESNLGHIALVTEAIAKIVEAERQYALIASLSDEELLHHEVVAVVAQFTEQMVLEQQGLIKQLDQARHALDHTG